MVCERCKSHDRLDGIVKEENEMLDFDVFCLKLRRWELHRALEESGTYIPAVVRENGRDDSLGSYFSAWIFRNPRWGGVFLLTKSAGHDIIKM